MRGLVGLILVLLIWHKTRLNYSEAERKELDSRSSNLLLHLTSLGKPACVRERPLNHQVTLFLSLVLLGDSGDVEINPGPKPYVYKGKYPCGVCATACKFKSAVIRCDSCNTWWHKECLGMSDSVFDDYVVDKTLIWECRNCLAINTSDTPFDTLLVDIPADTQTPQVRALPVTHNHTIAHTMIQYGHRCIALGNNTQYIPHV